MIDILKLMREKDELLAKRQELLDAVVAENRSYTDEELAEVEDSQAKVADYDRKIKEAQDIQTARTGNSPDDIAAALQEPAGDPAPEGFRSFGDFLQAVRWNTGHPGLTYREKVLDSEKRAMSMGVGTAGGFIVPEQFSQTMLQLDVASAIFRPRANVIPAGTPPDAAITMPALNQTGANGIYAGVTVKWIAEGGAKHETEPALLEVKLEPCEVAAHVIVTDKLLRNSAAAGALVSSLLRKAIIGAEEDTFLTGTGVGQPAGIIGHGSTINIARAVALQIAYADVIGMYSAFMFGGPAVWIASQTTLPQLMAMVDVGNHNVWQPSAREGAPGTLLGFPLILNDQSPVLGTQGDLVLVDLNYYLIKDGSGITIDMSDGYYFTSNKTIIKAYWNVDGQPWMTTPLTQRDGTSQVSPFVVLNDAP